MSAVRQPSDSSQAALASLAERFWHFQCHESPVVAIQAGVKLTDPVVFRESGEDCERRYVRAGEFLRELEAISDAGLAAQDWATHRLLRRELTDIRSFHAVRAHERPALFPLGPDFGTVYFANTAALTSLESAELYVERLATLPAYFADVVANLVRGRAAGIRYPARVLECAAGAARAQVGTGLEATPWFSPFRRTTLASSAVEALAARARKLIERELLPALGAYAEFLAGPLSAAARSSVAATDDLDGAAFYGTLVRHFTTTDLTPEAIHELGLAEVGRISAAMADIARDAGYAGDLPGYRRFVSTDPQFIAPSAEALREQIEVLSKRIDRRLPAFFGRLPRITYGVESIPAALSALLPPAYAQPNPADGSGPGIHWITSLPAKAPSFMHVPLALHEAWPGHLMHLALMQEMTELPAFRRYGALSYSACLEGWALYCEGLGVEMGLYTTPHQQYGRLDMEIWRALRLVVDTGMHTQGWSRERAIEYMAAHQALPRPTIEAEVDRYIGMPAQALAYQVGNLKFRELRQRAMERLGARFDVREYHDRLMAAGPVTLPVLERLIDDYLESRASAT
jgi:uncharacterized protein (DUF885 family)